MRKIKANGRTYKNVQFTDCHECDVYETGNECVCDIGKMLRETLHSKLSRLIKRLVRK